MMSLLSRLNGKRSQTAKIIDSRGMTTVELALVLPVFFILMFGVIDLGRLFYTQMVLQHAMREGGRFAVTGAGLGNRVQSIKATVVSYSPGLSLETNQVEVASQAGNEFYIEDPDAFVCIPIERGMVICRRAGDTEGFRENNAGGPGDAVRIRVEDYRLQLITPVIGQFFDDGAYTFSVEAIFKNEPF